MKNPHWAIHQECVFQNVISLVSHNDSGRRDLLPHFTGEKKELRKIQKYPRLYNSGVRI